ncbi:hypothetical protein FH063_003376 [Azospirillum argentinense]|uniref:Uncharacterized protein n=1 Tax=Azospirillum argentinense TaxID=2970906 RepID=A0A5B0KLP4_9PROT|nr:hypothetical protein FH063_003376 [Azospirillum argentinense]
MISGFNWCFAPKKHLFVLAWSAFRIGDCLENYIFNEAVNIRMA